MYLGRQEHEALTHLRCCTKVIFWSTALGAEPHIPSVMPGRGFCPHGRVLLGLGDAQIWILRRGTTLLGRGDATLPVALSAAATESGVG